MKIRKHYFTLKINKEEQNLKRQIKRFVLIKMMTLMMPTYLLSNYYKVLMSPPRHQARHQARNKASPSLQDKNQVLKFQVLKLQDALSLMKNQINVVKNPKLSLRLQYQHLYLKQLLEAIRVNLVVAKISVSSYLF